MKVISPGIRLWAGITLTLFVAAGVITFARYMRVSDSWDGMLMLVLIVLAILLVYSLIIYFLMRPGSAFFRSGLFKSLASVIATAAIAAGFIHYLRFIPSPEAAAMLSKVVATLLMVGGFSLYFLFLYYIWWRSFRLH